MRLRPRSRMETVELRPLVLLLPLSRPVGGAGSFSEKRSSDVEEAEPEAAAIAVENDAGRPVLPAAILNGHSIVGMRPSVGMRPTVGMRPSVGTRPSVGMRLRLRPILRPATFAKCFSAISAFSSACTARRR